MQPIFYVGFLVSLLMHLVNKEFQQSSFYGKHQSVISLKLLCQDQEIHDGVLLQTGLCDLLFAYSRPTCNHESETSQTPRKLF